MGVYLPNMKMPEKGQMLVIFPDGTSYVCFNGMRERLAQTEAVPVLPHGRLGDLDELKERATKRLYASNHGSMAEAYYASIIDLIDSAPTIIPASEEGET